MPYLFPMKSEISNRKQTFFYWIAETRQKL